MVVRNKESISIPGITKPLPAGTPIASSPQGTIVTTSIPGITKVVPTSIPPRRSGGGGYSFSSQSQQPKVEEQKPTVSVQVVNPILTSAQQFQARQQQQRQQFTGVVEVRGASQRIGGGQLQQRRFVSGGRQVAEESQLTRQQPQERQGKVTGFVVEKTRGGKVVAIQETREVEQSSSFDSAIEQNNHNINVAMQDINFTPVVYPNSQVSFSLESPSKKGLRFDRIKSVVGFSKNIGKEFSTSEGYGDFFSKQFNKINWDKFSPSEKTSRKITRLKESAVGTIGGKIGRIVYPSEGTIGFAKKVYDTSPFSPSSGITVKRVTGINNFAGYDIGSANAPSLLLLGAGSIPRGVGNLKYVETVPLRQRSKAVAYEYIETDLIKGKVIRPTELTIITEKQPPRLRYTTSANDIAFGRTATNVKILKAIPERTKTVFKAFPDEPYLTISSKGGKTAKFSEVSGGSKGFDILAYPNLPSQQKFLVERLAQVKAGGTPVSQSNVLKMLNKDDIRHLSNVNIENLVQLRRGKNGYLKVTGMPKKGATTRTYQALTETKLLKETEMFDYSVSEMVALDVTKPRLKNLKSNTPFSEMTIYTREKKPINVLSTEKNVGVIKPADIIHTPLDKTFALQKFRNPITIAPPRIPRAIKTSKVISNPSQTQIIAPSIYTGRGMYERTEGGLLPFSMNNIYPSYSKSSLSDISLTKTNQGSSQINFQPMLLSQSTRTIFKTPSREVSRGVSREISKEINKEIFKTPQKEIQKITQRQIQRQIQRLIQKPVTKVLTPGFPRNPPTKPPRQPPLIFFNLPKGKQQRSFGNGYSVLLKRFGKFKTIGSGLKLQEAFSLGGSATQRSLGRSFQVKGGSLMGGVVPKGYRIKNKKSGITFIEPTSQALNLGSEIGEIQSFKRDERR